jgi:hypothetical protein
VDSGERVHLSTEKGSVHSALPNLPELVLKKIERRRSRRLMANCSRPVKLRMCPSIAGAGPLPSLIALTDITD